MKPLTAANKLGIYLPATPESFQNASISRADLEELRTNPPQWLVELRQNGPHPRDIVAKKLGVSNKGLARGGVSDVMTAQEVADLLADPPPWLVAERRTYENVRKENERIKVAAAERAARTNRPAKNR